MSSSVSLASPQINLQQHTLAHIDCAACAYYEAMQILNGSASFAVNCWTWLENHRQYVKPSTFRVYRQYAKSLVAFLGNITTSEIHIGNIRGYQKWRSESAGPTRLNAEIASVLMPILKEVNRWNAVKDVYRPLPAPKVRVRQAMSEEQERRLLAIALDASKPRRLVAGHCLIVMANTGMGFGELRYLRREDCILNEDPAIVTVNPEGAKNDFRIRTIPLNWLALRSMRWIIKRWEELGGTEPDQYILPHHAKRSEDEKKSPSHKRKSPPNFYEPMGHIYRAARGILKDAGLAHLDPYDMRSHFGTKLLSDPNVSDQLFQEIFGHSNTRTRDRYSRQRIEKKAVAIGRLTIDPAPKQTLVVFQGRNQGVNGGY